MIISQPTDAGRRDAVAYEARVRPQLRLLGYDASHNDLLETPQRAVRIHMWYFAQSEDFIAEAACHLKP